MKYLLLIFFIFSTLSVDLNAARIVEEVDYFASLRASQTNVRAGPGQNYPIKFTFKAKAIPVHVLNEYDNWNEIEDYEGQTGWVSQSLITKKRTLLVRTTKDHVKMHSKDSEKSRIIYNLQNNVIGDYLKCSKSWCALKINGKKGWVKKSNLWGDD